MIMSIKNKIKQLEILIDELIEDGKYFNGEEINCPLKDDHWRLSQITNGIGVHEWECPFCGKGFST